jgi:hypothetical protein
MVMCLCALKNQCSLPVVSHFNRDRTQRSLAANLRRIGTEEFFGKYPRIADR